MSQTNLPEDPELDGAIDEKSHKRAVDLDAYCARIGHEGPRTPTIETLRALQERHPAAITFEAIDVLLGRGVDLSPAAVDRKLIDARRGGYCFEHNGLLQRVLVAIGFEVDALLARVHWMSPADGRPRPASHMALRVTSGGEPWLVDVGFGGIVPTSPLCMNSEEPQLTRHEPFRLIPFGDAMLLEVRLGGEWKPLYELLPTPAVDADVEVANWFTSTHPTSRFRRSLTLARTTPEARYALLDSRLTIRTPDGDVERRTLDADGIEHALAEIFDLPLVSGWRPMIERAAEAGDPGL